MSRRNRIDPWGDLHAHPGRGLFTGNRGCLVDASGALVRHHTARAWITCVTAFGSSRQPLAAPHTWTPVFFLDEAVALAAGHRPCAFCRRQDYRAFRTAAGVGSAAEIDATLASQRLRRGRGLDRRPDRVTWDAPIGALPTGTVVVGPGGVPHLIAGPTMAPFSFDGWGAPVEPPRGGTAPVLTPELAVQALRHGYQPTLHPSSLTA
jgi:hypothetical protein